MSGGSLDPCKQNILAISWRQFLVFTLMLSQTRSVFLFTKNLLFFLFTLRQVIIFSLALSGNDPFLLIALGSGIFFLLPVNFGESISESWSVIGEAVHPETIAGILEGQGNYITFASNP